LGGLLGPRVWLGSGLRRCVLLSGTGCLAGCSLLGIPGLVLSDLALCGLCWWAVGGVCWGWLLGGWGLLLGRLSAGLAALLWSVLLLAGLAGPAGLWWWAAVLLRRWGWG